MKIKAVLFDFDGTLTQPGLLNFSIIRKDVSCPDTMPVLEFIESLAHPEEKKNALAILEAHELSAAEKSTPAHHAERTVLYLKSMNIRVGIVSRNSLSSIRRAFQNFERIRAEDFDVVISRDDPVRPKPSGQGILLAAKQMNINPCEILLVGDYYFDIEAGKDAGSVTALLDIGTLPEPASVQSDFILSNIEDIIQIVQKE